MNSKTSLLRRAAVITIGLLAARPVRADFIDGQTADMALGDRDLMLGPDATFAAAEGVAVDPLTKKVFVADTGRNRVLRFGSVEAMHDGAAAEVVFGQANFSSFSAGGGAAGMDHPCGLALDAAGRLWVADTGHHRVLRFDAATTTGSGTPASGVLGQPDFTALAAATSATGMRNPHDVAVTPEGTLWVADSLNHRVLRFDNAASQVNGAPANAVLGQSAFHTNTPGTLAGRFRLPRAVEAESAFIGGTMITVRLWVAEQQNHRVSLFNSPAAKTSGDAADMVLGQPHFLSASAGSGAAEMNSPAGLAVSANRLWVADAGNHRVLRFDSASLKGSGGAANSVLGQSGFSAVEADSEAPDRCDDPSGLALDAGRLWIADSGNTRIVRHEAAAQKPSGAPADGVLGRAFIEDPEDAGPRWPGNITGMVMDPVSGKLFVSDWTNNRVLRFASTGGLTTNAAAEAVLGQTNFYLKTGGCTQTRLSRPWGMAMDHHGHLWVCDSENSRVLRFDNAATLPSGSAASHVLGQADFSSNVESRTAQNMFLPCGVAVEESYNSSTNAWTTHRLWVSDAVLSRVIRFENPLTLPHGAAASGILGQSGFSVLYRGWFASQFEMPRGICVDQQGRLWVADEGNHRVVRFDNAAQKANGAQADGVLLQPYFNAPQTGPSRTLGFRPSAVHIANSGRLYISEFGGGRVIWFENAAAQPFGAGAQGYLGASSWTDDSTGTGWGNINFSTDIAVEPGGRLWAADDRRLLRFTPQPDSIGQWRLFTFGPYGALGGQAANAADPDGDGFSNLLEYPWGTDALDAATRPDLQLSFSTGGTPRLDFTVPSPPRPDVRLQVQQSPNLEWWLPMAERAGVNPWSGAWIPLAGVYHDARQQWRLTHTGAAARTFYRLNAQLLP